MNIQPLIVGWREWVSLPSLGVPLIKVKIDTGAKTSALHAYNIKILPVGDKEYAEFDIHPIQNNDKISHRVIAEIIGRKIVKSSNGHKEVRLVIRSEIQIGSFSWNIDITLTSRDIMYHRMLLGRSAMENLIVNPSIAYTQGKINRGKILKLYELELV